MNNTTNSYQPILEADKRRKRKTTTIVLIIVAAVIALSVTFYFMISSFVKDSDAYKAAIEHLGNDPDIKSETGGINEYNVDGFHISTTNGHGDATFNITIDGKDKDIPVYLELTKHPDGKWEVVKMDK
ncbi:hypothetical protein [Flavobacterium sp.]|uniref:hypothetical protein n=1 Tax=Flavobacterium sp. TaxID=239 RepID=UPI00403491A5